MFIKSTLRKCWVIKITVIKSGYVIMDSDGNYPNPSKLRDFSIGVEKIIEWVMNLEHSSQISNTFTKNGKWNLITQKYG